tara:strand:+ start:316 stop:552 length:237 start_codon:yes stop_codon:yes gene_type:complete
LPRNASDEDSTFSSTARRFRFFAPATSSLDGESSPPTAIAADDEDEEDEDASTRFCCIGDASGGVHNRALCNGEEQES